LDLKFSIIIPVYNRPDEIDELLQSLTKLTYHKDFEIIVIEDGSDLSSEYCIKKYQNQLDIKYYYKENSGPGLSRNFGMQKAIGNYYIILDSDCLLPKQYLTEISDALTDNFTDAFGGPDASHSSFTTIQKAINYAMTSMLTTGGIRGKKNTHNKFQPRSFNMGLSKTAFTRTKGFGSQYFGEDIDLTFRLWENGFETQLIEKAFVYHKRRVNFNNFFKQTFNFGAARPILNKQHPNTAKITYWFPSVFMTGLFSAILFLLIGIKFPIIIFTTYFLFIFIDAFIQNKSLLVAIYSIWATLIQFLGYGLGFFRSFIRLHVIGKSNIDTFPKMFNKA
jgi:glycosyltransferase involved in cell wall biosynthesis